MGAPVTDRPSRTLAPDLFRDRHILVTGGGSGLGLAITRTVLALGGRVTICGRSEARLAAAWEGLEAEERNRTFVHAADVRDPGQVETLIAAAWEEGGALDGVVNNAAGNFLAASEDLSPNGFDAVVRTVLHGSFHVSSAAARRWIETERPAAIVNILATYAWTGSAFVVPSAVAKAGVLALTRSLAVEWATYGIRVNALAPGTFPTEGAWQRLLPTEEMEEEALGRIPLGRFGEPEELAELVAYLLTEGSSYMTGECITMDGGAWLAAGGLFNPLTRMPRDELKGFLADLKPKK